jgi:DNA-binding transcriptional ArsR family regulator
MAYQDQQMSEDTSVLAVLADPTRRSLLELLRRKPLPVGELAHQMPVSRPAVSQHLKILKAAQLVRELRHGTRHYFSLNPAGFGGLREYADSMWQEALTAFAAYVTETKRGATKSRGTHRPAKRKRGTITNGNQIRLD